IDPRREHKMPRLVIIVDEFADLMSTEKKNIQDGIQRIAQKARAAGIYLILATQRPDAKIIEGSIKTNFTSRMAFKMSNGTDSMVVLDETGAEKLLGRGDLLYRTSSMPNVERAQGAFVDTPEIKQFVKYIIDNNKCYFNVAAQKAIDEEVNPSVETVNGKTGGADHAVTSEYIDSLRIAVKMKVVSIALLQRKMGFGFPKAAKIFDWMVEEGYVVESQTGKQKQVVLTEEQFREKFGEL
ncbi:MAG TPA: cell division protein FtsK, partial [Clostridiales bacterium]|nr:cell division protein FtsK [Clostridiales bacterium]